MTEDNSMRLAILIDAENVQPVYADMIFQSAEAMGEVCSKEIFGAASALTTWVEPVLKYAIHPNLTIKAAKGKNSSDIALVIGAMDLVVQGNFDGVVIASSDSDFSALSVRLRRAGLQVIGMGTEKANALWRTACSSFVVLEQPSQKSAPAQRAAQNQPAKAAQPSRQAPQPSAQHSKSAPTTSHKERAAAIEQVIQKQLSSSGGRLQVSNLFPILNKLAEYRIDRQGAGKKPMNYLTSTFGEAFDFVNSADGKVWVSIKGLQPVEEAPVPAEAAEGPAEPEAVPSEAPETPAPQAPEAEKPEAAEPVPAEPAPEADDGETEIATRLLIEGGMDAEVAGNIVEILRTSADKRAAYNAIRRVYGSVDGRLYYNQAKDILENRAE